MSPPDDPAFEKAAELAREWSQQAGRIVRRVRRRNLVTRVLRAFLWMVFSTLIVIPALIAGGFLLGPKGYEGVITAPLVLFSLWGWILYWYFGRRASPRKIKKVELALLPSTAGAWLDEQRERLPRAAQLRIDRLIEHLEAFTPQLEGMSTSAPEGYEVRRLLAEELPELVRAYHKVPLALRARPLYGGESPESKFVAGLDTIERQLTQLHQRLASGDLHRFAVHQRYLDMKYNEKGDLDPES